MTACGPGVCPCHRSPPQTGQRALALRTVAVDTEKSPAQARSEQAGKSPASPIEDYALLSDLRTAALVGKDGSIDWLCLPRFDSPSVFARLLGDEDNGRWQIAPATEDYTTSRAYRDNTLVLDTEFRTSSGTVRLTDAMLACDEDDDDSPAIVRSVEGVSGSVEMVLRWVVRPAYSDSLPWVRRREKGDIPLDVTGEDTGDGGRRAEHILAVAGPTAVALHGDLLPDPVPHERKHEARFTVSEGQHLSWVMSYCADPQQPVPTPDPEHELAGAERFWSGWTRHITYDGPHAEAVRRSLAVLKGLTYSPTGGIVAAPTTTPTTCSHCTMTLMSCTISMAADPCRWSGSAPRRCRRS